MLAVPPSCRSRVDRSRTSVDLPDPFWPRIATVSPRSMVKLTPFSAATRRRLRRQPLRLPPSRRMNSLRRSWTSSAGTAAGSDGVAISTLDVCSAVWVIGLLLPVGEYGSGRARPRPSRAREREYGYSAEEHAGSHTSNRVGAKSNPVFRPPETLGSLARGPGRPARRQWGLRAFRLWGLSAFNGRRRGGGTSQALPGERRRGKTGAGRGARMGGPDTGVDGRPQVLRPARLVAAHDAAAHILRRVLLRRGTRVRRLVHPRLAGHRGVGHAAHAGPVQRDPRPVHRGPDVVAHLRDRRPDHARALHKGSAPRREASGAVP